MCGLAILLLVELGIARSEWIVDRFPSSSVGVIRAFEKKSDFRFIGRSRVSGKQSTA